MDIKMSTHILDNDPHMKIYRQVGACFLLAIGSLAVAGLSATDWSAITATNRISAFQASASAECGRLPSPSGQDACTVNLFDEDGTRLSAAARQLKLKNIEIRFNGKSSFFDLVSKASGQPPLAAPKGDTNLTLRSGRALSYP